MASPWNRENTEILINLYREAPRLWKIKCSDYKDGTERALALANIEKRFKQLNGASIDYIRKKIHALRNQFRVERRKSTKPIKSGSGAIAQYEPSLWCYKLLLYLEDGADRRVSVSSLKLT